MCIRDRCSTAKWRKRIAAGTSTLPIPEAWKRKMCIRDSGCIISKDADITVAFEVELPELYTVTGAEYEAIHGCWCKAIKAVSYTHLIVDRSGYLKS